MKNMMKKFFAALAAFAVMLSVVMPRAAVDPDEEYPSYEIWDEIAETIRD